MPKKGIPTHKIKEKLILSAIKEFSTQGIIETSLTKIGELVGIKRQSSTYHFASKEEILKIILERYDKVICKTVPSIEELDRLYDAKEEPEELLLRLFFTFSEADKELCQDIIRIIHKNMFYSEYIKDYIIENAFKKSEVKIEQCFIMLIKKGVLYPFDTKKAASILYKLTFTYATLAVLTEWEYDKSNQMLDDVREVIRMIVTLNKCT